MQFSLFSFSKNGNLLVFVLIAWFFFVIFLFDASLEISAKSRRRRSLFDSQIYRKIVEMAILLCRSRSSSSCIFLQVFLRERKTKINWRPKLHKKVLSPEFLLVLPRFPFLHRKKVDSTSPRLESRRITFTCWHFKSHFLLYYHSLRFMHNEHKTWHDNV